MSKRKAIIILGMHRSGTSAVTRICNILGADLGGKLLKAIKGNNDKGFFEHRDVVDVNDKILYEMQSSWLCPFPLEDNWWKKPEIAKYSKDIEKIINKEFAKKDLWAIKDPRICLTLPLLLPILEKMDIEPVFIFVTRSPANVAASLEKRDDFEIDKSYLLWDKYNLDAEKYSRNFKRSFIKYDDVILDWRKSFEEVTSELEVNWSVKFDDAQGEIKKFIDPNLRHHKKKTNLKSSSPKIFKWTEEIYKKLLEIGKKDNKTTQKDLDEISKEIKSEFKSSAEFIDFSARETNRYWKEIVDISGDVHKNNVKLAKLERKLGDYNKIKEGNERLNREVRRLTTHVENLQNSIEILLKSTSWKLTKPLRLGVVAIRKTKAFLMPSAYKKAFRIMQNRGLKGLFSYVKLYLFPPAFNSSDISREYENEYKKWIEKYEILSDKDSLKATAHMKGFKLKPLISIIMPVYNVEEKWLRAAFDSVIAQIYPNWELCVADDKSTDPHVKEILEEYKSKDSRIKIVYRSENGHISKCSNSALELVTGEYIALMDNDDLISKDALYYVVNEINNHPEADLIYSDEDKIDEEGKRFAPYFKPDWSRDMFFSQNVFNHLGVYRASIIKKIGGFRVGFEGSQDYDLVLRCLLHTSDDKIRHIPQVLYHWRAIEGSTALCSKEKSYTVSAAQKALESYFAETEQNVKISTGIHPFYLRVKWPVALNPKVSLIIPTRNGLSLLKVAVETILNKTTYKNYEILVVDNQSDDPATLEYFKKIDCKSNVRVIKYDKPFNYSAINNYAVTKSDGEIIGLINNDIEVIKGDWLTEMVSQALRPEIGAVGAKLLYPDDTVQHGGVVMGIGAAAEPVAGHIFHQMGRDDAGYFGRAIMTSNLSAVTAACLLVRRSVFDEVGGLNEGDLTVAFNDVDLCLKIREKNYNNLWTPYAELYHHESATRGKEDTPEKKARFAKEVAYMRKRWDKVIENDPYYNPNLNIEYGNFLLAFPPRLKKPWLK